MNRVLIADEVFIHPASNDMVDVHEATRFGQKVGS